MQLSHGKQKLSAHLLYVMSVEMRGFNKDAVPCPTCHHTVHPRTPKDSHTRAVPSLLISNHSSLSYPVSGPTWEAFFPRHSGLLLPLIPSWLTPSSVPPLWDRLPSFPRLTRFQLFRPENIVFFYNHQSFPWNPPLTFLLCALHQCFAGREVSGAGKAVPYQPLQRLALAWTPH